MNQNYASAWTRFIAALIDGVLLGIVNFVIGMILGLLLKDTGKSISSFVSLGLSVYYYVFYQASTGQTIGKKTMHIQVMTVSGQRPTPMTFFLREIVGKFVSFITLCIGYLMILWDGKKQGLHDKIAGTIVVVAGTVPVQPSQPVVSAPQVADQNAQPQQVV